LLSILDVIERSANFLAKRGVASPRLQVELLLAHVLKMPRMKLYLSFERVLTAAELDALRTLVQRRGQREPLQYIVGSTSFCGIELAVDRRVLIPRPETELLAERAWTFLKNVPGTQEDASVALDLGTGSGCLAIALAIRAPGALIHAVDISVDALALARENAGRHEVSSRIQFHEGDLFSAVPAQLRCDLIVSNPPYIPSARIDTLETEVRQHEPRTALDGGPDGLDFYRRISSQSAAYLRPAGRLMLELDEDGAEATREIFLKADWAVEAMEKDYNRQPRILVAHRPPP
jgi:release factor glutamine methyltransferase